MKQLFSGFADYWKIYQLKQSNCSFLPRINKKIHTLKTPGSKLVPHLLKLPTTLLNLSWITKFCKNMIENKIWQSIITTIISGFKINIYRHEVPSGVHCTFWSFYLFIRTEPVLIYIYFSSHLKDKDFTNLSN